MEMSWRSISPTTRRLLVGTTQVSILIKFLPAMLSYPPVSCFDMGMEFSNRWVVVQSTGNRNDLAQSQVFLLPARNRALYR
jgi:hypothetical protein